MNDDELRAAEAMMSAGFGEEGAIEEPVPPTDEPEEEVELPEAAESEPEDDEDEKVVPLKAVIEERKKRQELEAQLKQLAQFQEELKQNFKPPVQPPKDIYEAYDRDSDGVIRDLNGEIKRLVDNDPYGNATKIEQLRDLKDELRRREVQRVSTQLSQQTEVSKFVQKLNEVVPNIADRQKDLTVFAVEELGYTLEELQQATSFARGDSAVREVARIAKLYDKFKAAPEKKEVRPRAPHVETAGRGVPKANPEAEVQAVFKRAKSTGSTSDWAEYLVKKGLV